MAHFHPLRWEIDLSDHHSSSLESDPVVQATFLHEYVHYVQALTGTIGRRILLEMVRLAIFAGHSYHHGWPAPADRPRLDLRAALESASPSDFHNTKPRQQYKKLIEDLRFALGDAPTPAPADVSPGAVFRRALTLGPNTVDDFVHVVGSTPSGTVAVPITDRVVFENMARQIQLNYLRFNNDLKTAVVRDLRSQPGGDVTYVCLRDALEQALPTSEDSEKWTVVLCQVALLCRHPGGAFAHMLERLAEMREPDLTDFVRRMKRDDWFLGEFNVPPVQETLHELVGKYGTAIQLAENHELRELTKLIAHAHNALRDDYALMASPLIEWAHVLGWVDRFGCPPLSFSDGILTEIQGRPCTSPWTWYFRRLDDLLGSNPILSADTHT